MGLILGLTIVILLSQESVILLSQESVKTWGLILGLTGVNKLVIVEYRIKNRSEFVKIHWTKGKTLKSLTQNVLPSWIDVC